MGEITVKDPNGCILVCLQPVPDDSFKLNNHSIRNHEKLEGKIAVVTGTSKGIGAAIAKQ